VLEGGALARQHVHSPGGRDEAADAGLVGRLRVLGGQLQRVAPLFDLVDHAVRRLDDVAPADRRVTHAIGRGDLTGVHLMLRVRVHAVRVHAVHGAVGKDGVCLLRVRLMRLMRPMRPMRPMQRRHRVVRPVRFDDVGRRRGAAGGHHVVHALRADRVPRAVAGHCLVGAVGAQRVARAVWQARVVGRQADLMLGAADAHAKRRMLRGQFHGELPGEFDRVDAADDLVRHATDHHMVGERVRVRIRFIFVVDPVRRPVREDHMLRAGGWRAGGWRAGGWRAGGWPAS
jgi:hypothetical protein